MNNKIIQLLEIRPCTYKELSGHVGGMGLKNRQRIRRMRVSANYSRAPGRGRFLTIYYLEGDEDRAVDMFAKVNAEALSHLNFRKNTVLDSGLPKEMVRKLRMVLSV